MTSVYIVEKNNGQVGVLSIWHSGLASAAAFEKRLSTQPEVRKVTLVHRTEMDYPVQHVACYTYMSAALVAQKL